jgi:hypothetical protein
VHCGGFGAKVALNPQNYITAVAGKHVGVVRQPQLARLHDGAIIAGAGPATLRDRGRRIVTPHLADLARVPAARHFYSAMVRQPC